MKKGLIVIIGASASGKSRVLEEISNRGYNVYPETARKVLEERKKFKPTKEEIKIRQNIIYENQKNLENSCRGLNFLERSIIDIFGFSEYYVGRCPSNVDLSVDFSSKYSKIFNLIAPKKEKKGDFGKGSIRIEKSFEEAEKVQNFVLSKYNDFGYNVLDVPFFSEENKTNSIKKRVDYILTKLNL
jgi:predicted ATPase